MTSVRGRVAKRLVQVIGLKRRLQALAEVEGDAAALQKGVKKLRQTDRRRPPRSVRRRWHTELIDCDGNDLFLMFKGKERSRRVVIYLHGGGYMFGPFGTEWAAIRRVADGSDVDFAMFLYPRAPENDARTTLSATSTAYSVLLERYGDGNVVVVGTSAGGGLAVALMVSLRDSQEPLPCCAILLSPGVDMTLHEDVADLEPGDVMLPVDHVRSAGRIYAGALDPSDPIVSPINADLSDLPPTYLFVADSEILRPSIETFADRAREAGTPTDLILGAAAQHTWPAAPTPEGRRALDQIVQIVQGCN
jgi:acetyl esterase/lipase